MGKQVDKLHLVYGYIIFGIVLLSVVIIWILSCKGVISETAFQNFSFAASVVSIVLAVVSIVYSMKSGAGVAGSVDILQEAGRDIRENVKALDGLEDHIVSAVQEGFESLGGKIDTVKNQIEPLLQSANANSQVVEGNTPTKFLIDIERNSNYGNVILYICLKAFETKKSWNIDIMGSENKDYVWGYLVAMSSIPSVTFSYEYDTESNLVSSCSFDPSKNMPTKDDILKLLKKRETYEKLLKSLIEQVDKYFES